MTQQVDFIERAVAFPGDATDPESDAGRAGAQERARHAKLKRWFEEAEEANRTARTKAERDQDYYDNKQITDAELKVLESRGQPAIAINLVRRKVDFLRGMEVKQRTDPKAWARTPADAEAAEIATDTLRYVFDACQYAQRSRKWAWKDMLVVGWGGIQLQMRKGRPDQITQALGVEPNSRMVWRRTPWDRMFWDPHSSEHDFADARYRGLVIWMDKSDALEAYRDIDAATQIIEGMLSSDGARGTSFDDKPRTTWVDATRRRIRVVQIWWKERGSVYWAEFTEAGVLASGESDFVDADDEPCDNFVWQSCYVDRDNNRSGIVRDMIDPQDEINKRRSKALHLLSVRQVIADEGAVSDVEKARRQLARPDGWITKNPGLELQVVQNGDLSAGQMNLLAHATAELEKMGPNEALQGQGAATSGRDRQAQQQGGMVELGPTIDDLLWMDHRAYELTWRTIQNNWTAPQFIRVTDDENAPRFVGVNEPMVGPQGQIAGMRNQPAQIHVDIIIQPAPDTTVIEQEVWTDLAQLMPTLMQAPPPMQKFIIEASPLPASRKKKLMDLLEKAMQPQQQDPMQAQMAQKAMMLEMAEKEAGVAKLQADAQSGAATMAIKQTELEIKRQEQAIKAQEMNIRARESEASASVEMARLADAGQARELERRRLELEEAIARDRSSLEWKKLEQAEQAAVMAQAKQMEDIGEPEDQDGPESSDRVAEAIGAGLQAIAASQSALAESMSRPKSIVRGPDGRPTGIE